MTAPDAFLVSDDMVGMDWPACAWIRARPTLTDDSGPRSQSTCVRDARGADSMDKFWVGDGGRATGRAS